MRNITFLFTALFGIGTVFADSSVKTFNDWATGLMNDSDGLYAATVNDSGGIIGQYCFFESGNCVWVLATDVKCNDKGNYPVLINSDYAAAYIEVTCVNTDGNTRYIFNDFDLLNKHVTTSRQIGFAFPMQDGKFQVTRFSLDGASDAIGFMTDVYQEAIKDVDNKKINHTRDIVL